MFKPKFVISHRLLANIKEINSLILELNNRRFPQTALAEFEKEARAISSFASTSIEGNPLPLTDVRRILKSRPQNIKTSEEEVLNYNKALEKLDEKLKKGSTNLNISLILSIHKQVTQNLVSIADSGKFHRGAVFVNNPSTRQTVYRPPDPQDVPKLMKQLIAYTKNNQNIIDPLILAGIFHKQFVIIHPFMDGNGRTGRLTTKVLLAQMGLDTFHLFSFENYYNVNVTNYFKNVGEVGNYYDLVSTIDFTKWLEYFTEGIIAELLRVKKEISALTITPQTELKPYHQKILHFIRQKGYITDSDYAKLTQRAKATRSLDFKKLTDLGIIQRFGKGRATYYK